MRLQTTGPVLNIKIDLGAFALFVLICTGEEYLSCNQYPMS